MIPESQPSCWASSAGGATIALTGVLVTSMLNWIFRKQDRRWRLEDEARLRDIERGEELYSLLHLWSITAYAGFMAYLRVMKGEIDYNSALDIVIESGKRNQKDFERIDLLFSVYFPDLHEKWKSAKEFVHISSSIESRFREKYKRGIIEC